MHATISPRLSTALFAVAVMLVGALLPQTLYAQSNDDEGPSDMDIRRAYSLYTEDYNNEEWESAAPNLRWILEHAPTAPFDDDRNYRRAVDLYTGLAEKADDESERVAYLDSAAVMLSDAPNKLDDKGIEYSMYRWEMNRGRFLQQYGSELNNSYENLVNAPTHYERAFEIDPQRIQTYFINEVIEEYVERGDQGDAIAFMGRVEELRGDDEEVMTIVNRERDRIFDRNPNELISYLEGVVEDDPENVEVISQLFSLYIEQGRLDAANELAEDLITMDPPAEIYVAIAQLYLEDGEHQEAFDTFETAVEKGAELTAENYHSMGQAQERMGQLSKARTYFRRALEVDDSFARAHVSIGDLYVQAVSECAGSEMGRSDRAVYWLAVDHYERAQREGDQSVANNARNKANTYREYFPSTEDVFYRDDWAQGESTRIDSGCYSWINESTTVRTR
ncbi:MAG: tetratricopeptide repeat protein [Longimonas sp.]|uniref:tetratricopeptide repeat protein n=1 Tax=Longimonas sp. TaxID=2039626 RepID=UPI003350B0C4